MTVQGSSAAAAAAEVRAASGQEQASVPVVPVPVAPPVDCLEETAFRHFAPLLGACQGYAARSGCRFRSASFDGLENAVAGAGAIAAVPASRAKDSGPRLAAKLTAAPAVSDFRARLNAGDEMLVEEVDRAFRIVMAESVRNAMMGMFQTLEMFPPTPPPLGISDDDCAYEDVTAPLPAVAQRLYNDQARRVSDACGGPGVVQKRAMTAAFLVDFAEAVGYRLPPVPETQSSMLKEISTRIQEELKRRGDSEEVQNRARDAFLGGLGAGAAAEGLKQEAQKWWTDNWRSVAWAAAGMAVVGIAAVATAVLSNRGDDGRRRGRREL
mmetsp:Transcript_95452/g.273774  ORF Transcript_95452/g.273774 Transcript_95452/m.273774 type:complete len:325 (+) Transcript_95452:91-1065(+)